MAGYAYSLEEWQVLLPWVEASIPIPPVPAVAHLEDRVRGMLFGLAIGDALGNTSEGKMPPQRHHLYGEVRDYLPNPHAGMEPVGLPSDDSQLAFWTVESLLQCGRLDPRDLAAVFARSRIFGCGSSVRAFLLAYYHGTRPWHEAGQPSAGNGALMRIAPVLLPHLHQMTEGLWVDTVAATVLTHRDEAAVAAGVGFIGVLAECLALPEGNPCPLPIWWPQTFLRYARAIETGRKYHSRIESDTFAGTLCDRVEAEVPRSLRAGERTSRAAERWHSGAYLLETVPCVLHILARHGDDPEEAIVRAVNDTQDNDTTAAVVGAAVGALHGESALPQRWRAGLLGRTREDDDGRVQELIRQAVETFVSRS